MQLTSGSIGTAEGSALVRMGDTTIVCGIKAEIAEPSGAAPDEGFVGECRASESSRLQCHMFSSSFEVSCSG